MLHTRDKAPDIDEVVDEEVWEVEETDEPLYERDAATGVLLVTDKTVKVKHGTFRKTGRQVQTGSRLLVDVCTDCGGELIAAGDRPFYYLICARIAVKYDGGKPEGGRWLPGPDGWEVVVSEEPYAGCVLECGSWKVASWL